MGVMGLLSNAKARFREMQTNNTLKRAENLKALKEERLRLEGQQNIRNLEAQEKAKIKAMRMERLKGLAAPFKRAGDFIEKQGEGSKGLGNNRMNDPKNPFFLGKPKKIDSSVRNVFK